MEINEIEIGKTYKTKLGTQMSVYGYELVKVLKIELGVLVSWADGQKTWVYPSDLFN